MNRIDQTFLKEEKLISIYFTAGYPNLNDTIPIIKKLQKAGVDIIEIGLPFSDPLADGPTIQESSSIALNNGMNSKKLFDPFCRWERIVIPYVNDTKIQTTIGTLQVCT